MVVDSSGSRDKKSVRVKIITLGDAEVGKSCLIKRYCERRFVDKYVSTIGIDYGVTVVSAGGRDVKVNFFDMSGQPLFVSIRREFYKDTQGIMLVYDVTNVESFSALQGWLDEVSDEIGPDALKSIVVAVCANKINLHDSNSERVITQSVGVCWAQQHSFKYFEVSACTGEGVEAMFDVLFGDVVKSLESGITERASQPSYSDVEIDAVKRVEAARNHWERLGLSVGACSDAVNRNYRKLARILHPDKNRAPGSEEAFKAVCAAKNALLGGNE